ncbi:hypothetical protein [Pseudomonas sp. ANT_J28]|uniref:hypothetical protein n=1 Tax=Pseudomonas sp. ANT_J28 TaxID=2597352 RepID=UPI0011F277D3|nr:hypothetical protein [Pseudomonas sp. ANT_J28]KAA0985362.1 hypothetical protein FQ187_05210 [Pseudomonas sp. ANT_J28]
MSQNLIRNGNFETGDFTHWKVIPGGGTVNVIKHNNNYVASLQCYPAAHPRVKIESKFASRAQEFTGYFSASLPFNELPDDDQRLPLVNYQVTVYQGESPVPVQAFTQIVLVRKNPTLFEFSFRMKEKFDRVIVSLYPTSDSAPVEWGPFCIDNIKYFEKTTS